MTPEEFEERVRRIARSMWQDTTIGRGVGDPIRPQGGPAEIDTIIHTRFETIVIDATVSAQASIIKEKIASIKAHRKNMSGKFGKPFRAFIITAKEPTQHQIQALKESRSDWISLYSYSQFQSLMVDATGYLACRSRFRFGSVRGLSRGGEGDFPPKLFVKPDFSDFGTKKRFAFGDVEQMLLDKVGSARVLIAGIFGMGKSMTTRALFYSLRQRFEDGQIERFPLHLNLDDHQGQTEPDEAIRRHADKIGLRTAADGLIQAWRAGLVSIILDGFDELVATPWSSEIQKRREVRRISMSLIKKFVMESPQKTPIVIAGRWTYFDDTQEMYDALGLDVDSPGFRHLDIEDFTDRQMREFLAKIDRPNANIPSWLPSRPLLVGYLATIAETDQAIEATLPPDQGWVRLIDMVAEREERQDFRLERNSVKEILQRLATHARETEDGLGMFSDELILRIFTAVTGANPDFASVNVVLRLPFLRPTADGRGYRSFLDSDSASALRAGDVLKFVRDRDRQNVFEVISPKHANRMPSSQLTMDIIGSESRRMKFTGKQIFAAAERANNIGYSGVAAELMLAAASADNIANAKTIIISEACFHDIDLSDLEKDLSFVVFRNCVFDSLHVDLSLCEMLPQFNDCLFGEVGGVASVGEIPDRFTKCEAERYDTSYATNADAVGGSLPAPVKAMQTVIRKLFFQRGAARREGAFLRGKLPHQVRDCIKLVIEILIVEGFCGWGKAGNDKVLVPKRGKSAEAKELLYNPMASRGSVMKKVLDLKC